MRPPSGRPGAGTKFESKAAGPTIDYTCVPTGPAVCYCVGVFHTLFVGIGIVILHLAQYYCTIIYGIV